MKKISKIFLSVVLCIPYLIIWYFILMMASVGFSEGIIAVFKCAFGVWSVWAGLIFACVAFFSIIYLRLFIKKEWIIHITAYLLTVIFFIMGIIFLNLGTKKFSEFSTEKWENYPEMRITMYFDLKDKYDIKGYTSERTEVLLGTPDKIADDGTYIYDDRHGNSVYVEFEKGKATEIYVIE